MIRLGPGYSSFSHRPIPKAVLSKLQAYSDLSWDQLFRSLSITLSRTQESSKRKVSPILKWEEVPSEGRMLGSGRMQAAPWEELKG